MCLVSLNDLALDLYNFDPNIKLGNWTLLLICELNKYVSRMGILVTGAVRQCCPVSTYNTQLSPGAPLNTQHSTNSPSAQVQSISRQASPPPTPPRPNGSDRGFPRAIWEQRGGKFMQPSPAELSWLDRVRKILVRRQLSLADIEWVSLLTRYHLSGLTCLLRSEYLFFSAGEFSRLSWCGGIVRGVKRAV